MISGWWLTSVACAPIVSSMSRRTINGGAGSPDLEKILAMHDMPRNVKTAPPKISIGLVVYNGAEHIRGALDSIVRQSYQNIELIVVDGGSTDDTRNILGEYAEHISVLVSEPDKGIYDAMNKVNSLATGDWLIFLGCDDVLFDVLGKVVKLMTLPDSLYYGDVIFLSNGEIYGGKFSKYRLMRTNFCHQALFYPRSAYKTQFYSLNYRWLADYAYNLKLVGAGVPFTYIKEIVAVYNDKGASSQGDAEFEKRKIGLICSSIGPMYAALEFLCRLKDFTARAIGRLLKRLLPYACWKFLQTQWRKMQKHFRN